MPNLAEMAAATDRFGRLRPAVRKSLEKALDGIPVSTDEALQLLTCDAAEELPALLSVAGHLRTRHKGTVVTYSPKVFLPITNLCRDRCSYCTFRADPDDPNAWTMTRDEVRESCRGGRSLGCSEALMCLGDKPERAFRSYRATLAELGHKTTISYVAEACEIALDEGMLPHTNAGLMTREEMRRLRETNVSLGLMLENVSPRLRRKGQAHYYAPDKDPVLRLQMMREAGELGIAFTTGILLGIGETPREVVESFAAIDQLNRDHGHIQEIIVQNFRAKPTTPMANEPEPASCDMARAIAAARLMMPTMNIQAPPNLSPLDHRLFLASGINDWGGISPLTPDFVNPEAPWPHIDTLRETCAEAGFQLHARLPVYDEYIDSPTFLNERLRAAIAAFERPTGALPC